MRRWASLMAMRRTILDRPADQILMVGIRGLFWGVTSLARYRITAIEHDEGDVAMPAMP